MAGMSEAQNIDIQARHGGELARRKDTMICIYGIARERNFTSLAKR